MSSFISSCRLSLRDGQWCILFEPLRVASVIGTMSGTVFLGIAVTNRHPFYLGKTVNLSRIEGTHGDNIVQREAAQVAFRTY